MIREELDKARALAQGEAPPHEWKAAQESGVIADLQSQLDAAETEIVELKGTLYAHTIDPCLGCQIRDDQLDAARERNELLNETRARQARIVQALQEANTQIEQAARERELVKLVMASREALVEAHTEFYTLRMEYCHLTEVQSNFKRGWLVCHEAIEAIDKAIAAAHPEPGADVDGADRGKL